MKCLACDSKAVEIREQMCELFPYFCSSSFEYVVKKAHCNVCDCEFEACEGEADAQYAYAALQANAAAQKEMLQWLDNEGYSRVYLERVLGFDFGSLKHSGLSESAMTLLRLVRSKPELLEHIEEGYP